MSTDFTNFILFQYIYAQFHTAFLILLQSGVFENGSNKKKKKTKGIKNKFGLSVFTTNACKQILKSILYLCRISYILVVIQSQKQSVRINK